MREPCRFYSFLMPLTQHEGLVNLSRKEDVPIAVLLRRSIGNMLEAERNDGKEVLSGK